MCVVHRANWRWPRRQVFFQYLSLLGKAKAIGVSNYTVRHLKEMEKYASVMPHLLQVSESLHAINSEGTVSKCRNNLCAVYIRVSVTPPCHSKS